MCGCTNKMQVKGAVRVRVAEMEDCLGMVVAGAPSGETDLKLLSEALKKHGFERGDDGVFAKGGVAVAGGAAVESGQMDR